MVSNLFNKDWDRAISPLVGAPRTELVSPAFSPSLRVREMETRAAFDAIDRANQRGAEQLKWMPATDDRPREMHVWDMKIKYALAEGMAVDLDVKSADAMRTIWADYFKDLEARLLAAICEKLKENGRIAPGEPLLKEPNPDGRGFILYSFPVA